MILFQACLFGLLFFIILKGYPGLNYIKRPETPSWVERVKTYTAVDLRHEKFAGAWNLHEAHLEGARFDNDDLSTADLIGASAQNSNLASTDLSGADLSFGHFEYSNLNLAHGEKATLIGTHFDWANLSLAELPGSNIATAQFANAVLPSANLSDSIATGANFSDAQLLNADLERANLIGADFNRAKLRGANLAGARLLAVKNLTPEQLGSVCTLYGAVLDKDLADIVSVRFKGLTAKFKRNDEGSCVPEAP
jgi:hypothetical protein